jgi:hypothetical protein
VSRGATDILVEGSLTEAVYFQQSGAEHLEPVEQHAEFLLILK